MENTASYTGNSLHGTDRQTWEVEKMSVKKLSFWKLFCVKNLKGLEKPFTVLTAFSFKRTLELFWLVLKIFYGHFKVFHRLYLMYCYNVQKGFNGERRKRWL